MNSLKRILLVEDNFEDIELTLEALKGCHLANTVVVVRDGAEALDYLHRRNAYKNRIDAQPVVIFLDIKMPKVDGVEVLRQIKADSDLQSIPVVMVTSSLENKDLHRSYQLGANSYVVKPIDYQQFINAIQELGLYWAVLNETPVTSD